MEDYFIGIDMGTNSLGWAVTDKNYNLIRCKGKDMWGVRIIPKTDSLANRRKNRCSRRRLSREKARIGFLKMCFADEINKIDPCFFQRLDESTYWKEDRTNKNKSTIFNDENFKDSDYFEKYKTIFHLRKELIESDAPHDVRLVFLALLNMFKHRGNFIASSQVEDMFDLKSEYDNLRLLVAGVMNIDLPELDANVLDKIKKILSDNTSSKTKKNEKIMEQLGLDKKKDAVQFNLWKLVCGSSVNLSKLFNIKFENKEDNKKSIDFKNSDIEALLDEAECLIGEERSEILWTLKRMYDTGILLKIMDGQEQAYLSIVRVEKYEKHKKDLKILQSMYRNYAPELYDEMFRKMNKGNYSDYIGSCYSGYTSQKAKNGMSKRKDVYNDLCVNIKNTVSKFPDSSNKEYILSEIENGTFLPKQMTAENGVIPNSIHKKEMVKILDNAKKYLSFLNVVDETGLSVADKIVSVFEFTIPYYIGPISYTVDSTKSGVSHRNNMWSCRKEKGQIYPWNFEEKIDVQKSAENFIVNLINRCTYLNDEVVLPKNSLLYEKFTLLNELNMLKINGEKISVDLKQELYNNLFCDGKKITLKRLREYLLNNGYISSPDDSISGVDNDGFKSTRANYFRFANNVFDVDIMTYEQEQIAEEIIRYSTIFGKSKDFLKNKLTEKFNHVLSKQQINKVIKYSYSKWGTLSKELLYLEGADTETGEIDTIINRMWNDNYTFIELVSGCRFTYHDVIEAKSKKLDKTLFELEYDDLIELNMSVAVRRMVWQTVLLLKEITKLMNTEPAKIFIEMAREHGANERTISRKNKISDLYKSIGKDDAMLLEYAASVRNIDSFSDADLRRKKLYLYYMQLGRSMYTGEKIDVDKLLKDNETYDIDHIYAQRWVKNDSLDNNLVLVEKVINNDVKKDNYPLPSDIRMKMLPLWTALKKNKFINDEKYFRLTRDYGFDDNELAGFINRQLVETRQGTKTVATLFKNSFKTSDVIYVKAGLVSDFRAHFALKKCRILNDLHHAKDAYLNIVVGNVYDTKFTKHPRNYIKEFENQKDGDKKEFNLKTEMVFKFDVIRNGYCAWCSKGNKSISIVKSVMARNTPIVTRMTAEYNGTINNGDTIKRAVDIKEGATYNSIKSSNMILSDASKYGARDPKYSYFFIVEHTEKKTIRSIEAMPLYLKNKYNGNNGLIKYCEEKLGYKSVRLIYGKFNPGTLVKIDGYYYYITGKSGQKFSIYDALQLRLNKEMYNTVCTIEKYNSSNVRTKYIKEVLSDKALNTLFQELIDMNYYGILSRRKNSIGKVLYDNIDKFRKLNFDDKITVISNVLGLIKNNCCDLTIFNAKKRSGTPSISKNITSYKEFKIVNLSVTGMYRKEVDILK